MTYFGAYDTPEEASAAAAMARLTGGVYSRPNRSVIKLNSEAVKVIRCSAQKGRSQRLLAVLHEVSRRTVRDIVAGATWAVEP